MKEDQSQRRIVCLLTDEQFEAIKRAAKEAGLSASAYIRFVALERAKGVAQ